MNNFPLNLLPLSLLLAAGPALAQEAPASTTNADNSIQLLSLNQPPCSVPAANAVLKFKLAYQLAENEQSPYGFAVSVKFQTTQNSTFSMGRYGQVTVTARHDTLEVSYPLAALTRLPVPPRFADKVPKPPTLHRPLTCYLYLHRYTAPGRSTVLATTPPIVFQNCQ